MFVLTSAIHFVERGKNLILHVYARPFIIYSIPLHFFCYVLYFQSFFPLNSIRWLACFVCYDDNDNTCRKSILNNICVEWVKMTKKIFNQSRMKNVGYILYRCWFFLFTTFIILHSILIVVLVIPHHSSMFFSCCF